MNTFCESLNCQFRFSHSLVINSHAHICEGIKGDCRHLCSYVLHDGHVTAFDGFEDIKILSALLKVKKAKQLKT